MNNINKTWHLANKMPVKPTTEDRIQWHLEHVKNCSCRGIPEKLLTEIKSRSRKNPCNKNN